MGPKTLPTIWYTYMTLVTKYQISAINNYCEKCDEKCLGWTDRQTEVKQYTPSPFEERGYNYLIIVLNMHEIFALDVEQLTIQQSILFVLTNSHNIQLQM